MPLGEWVLRRACSDAVSWTEPVPVAVNLSPAQFRDADMAETVAEVLQETGLPPQRLELEITESPAHQRHRRGAGKLKRLRELGVRIVMDDFGTGYSSFNYLARFAFDKIKIDRQFVRNMTRDPAMRAIVKTIITLGKSLDVTVTAEGVESEEQAAMLREFGCPEAQGFLYGQPGAPDATGNGEGHADQARDERRLIIGGLRAGARLRRRRPASFSALPKNDMMPWLMGVCGLPHHAAGLRCDALRRYGLALLRRSGLRLGFRLGRDLGLWLCLRRGLLAGHRPCNGRRAAGVSASTGSSSSPACGGVSSLGSARTTSG